ncbi:efflux RND transporter periplasmic adaptor subunit [Desulfolithobacter sp.]
MTSSGSSPSLLLRLTLCVLIIGAGVGGFVLLQKMKKPPQHKDPGEHALPVEVVTVQPGRATITVDGYGEIRSRSRVEIAAEVTGRVVSVYGREQDKGGNLEPGVVVRAGEVLLLIDDRDYRLEYESSRARLKILERDLVLAERELARVRELYELKRSGSISSVEQAESSCNAVRNQVRQLQQAMELARLRMNRCVIRAPFTCRIAEVHVEVGSYVSPGRQVLTLVDDRDLEVQIGLDSREALRWLRFEDRTGAGFWFGRPLPVTGQVQWVEDARIQGRAVVDRVVRFDPKSRTLVVALRLSAKPGSGSRVPLVEGMYCRVTIPGAVLENVFVLPRRAVTFDSLVYVAVENRLQTRKVEVARVEDDRALVTAGLEPGEQVIVTRLDNPLENSLLSISSVSQTDGVSQTDDIPGV